MSNHIRLGFEVFPPKSGTSESFEDNVARLAEVGDYVSLTYGASGSGRDRSETAINALISNGLADKIAAHLTASSQSKDRIDTLARDWKAKGVRRIVALRGDAPALTGDEYSCAADLTEALNKIGGFDIAVACYPEGHPKSASKAAEMDHLKRKFAAGASEAITQFFFNIEDYLRFRDDCRAAGIDQPIIPGLLPIASLEGLHRFAAGCGAKVPGWLDARFAGLEDDPETVRTLSVATTVSLSDRLIAEGVDHIHLYTLNRVRDALTIARALGITGTTSAVITQKEEAA